MPAAISAGPAAQALAVWMPRNAHEVPVCMAGDGVVTGTMRLWRPGSAKCALGFAGRTQKFSQCLVSPTNCHRTKSGQRASV